MTRFTSTIAVVTGGSRGIGFATAMRFLQEGATVAVLGTRDETLREAHDRLAAAGNEARVGTWRCDVRDAQAVAAAFDGIVGRFGGIDVLVNSAGIGRFAPVEEMTLDDFRAVLDTNVAGVFHACQAAIPHMKRRGRGWIVNISSLSSTGPFPKGAAYCASKAAVNAMTDALLQEVRYDGIRVSCVLPGSVNTTFGGHASTKADWALMPEDVAEAIVDLVAHPSRSLPSRLEIRPAQPQRKG